MAPTDAVLALDCPGITGQNFTVTLGQSPSQSWMFQATCGADYHGTNIDVVAVIVYSFHDCLQACASMNFNAGKTTCKSIEFNGDMPNIIPRNYGTCFLKNSIPPITLGNGAHNVAAALVS